jgi:hypothetical protein
MIGGARMTNRPSNAPVAAAVLGAATLLGARSVALGTDRTSRPHEQETTFVYESSSFRQELTVQSHGAKKVDFKIVYKGKCSRSEGGTAALSDNREEMDEEPGGTSSSVRLYEFKREKECYIYLRIDAKRGDRATVTESPECNPGCPLDSDVVMHKR